MNHKRDLLSGIVLYCAVVEQSGITAAARILRHTPSHVSKELMRLEARLGTRLLNRTTRNISLTESGRIYYESARQLVAKAKTVEDKIQMLSDHPYGELKISVPVILAQACFSAWMPEFLQSYPDVNVNVNVTDRYVDLVAESFDIAIRFGNLPDSDLVSRELFRTLIPTLAAPAYLEAYGTPQHPKDLLDHHLIAFSSYDIANDWSFPVKNGAHLTLSVSPRVRCNEANLERTLVLAGEGITRLPEFAYKAELDEGRLIRILQNHEPPPVGVHMLYPNRQHLPKKTRVMIDFIIAKAEAQFKNWKKAA